MLTRVVARYVRVSPRKVRQVIDLIRGHDVESSFAILANVKKAAAHHVEQVLKSAVASAKQKTEGKATPGQLVISGIFADGGPMLKRYKAAAMGRAVMIRRRTSHITVELDTSKPVVVSKTLKTTQKGKSKPR